MTTEADVPVWNISDCSRAARRMLALRCDLPVALLRKHNREFFRGAHPGKS